MSTIEMNKALARHFLELAAGHDLDGLISMVTPDWTMHGGPPDLPPGPDGVRHLFEHIGRAQQRWTVEDLVAEGDKVVVRATNTCVQDSFLGIPSAGRTQVFTATFIHRIVAGRIQTTWRNADDLGRLRQIGASIKPGSPTE